ncbi:DUF6415 family natural product biosynthesis protein [Streptomyces cadmiisoli]|uniref:Uncharacterized protein n=1 Tax=Streptomyces cadmiisoli TaxID=2184053 RepID=A0A2Z4JAD9_9ACTN|nr:DUF6415 family natural product biosynthesis protein [Streptomyces cadmiisoli]AWW35364.1 hypothetical protein DN051_00495 [Streptomyces cadmiisoli]AWW42075.1 hypothetical protein DN051_40315 [Streptomyces cadmiisoli]
MADAASSATATVPAPRPAGAGNNVPVDSETIRQSYEAVLSASRRLASEDWERLGGLLRGHVQLLVPELAGVEPRMRGEQRRTARHVLAGTRHRLAEGIGTSSKGVWDLAIQCRALLTLHEHPGPLQAARPVAGVRS